MSAVIRPWRNFFSSGLASWTEFLLGMLASVMIARSLMPEQYGHFSFLMWCATLYIIVSNGGLSTGAIKFVAEANGPERQTTLAYLAQVQRLSQAAIALLAILIVALFPDFFLASAGLIAWCLLLAAAWLKAGYIFWMSARQGEENFPRIARVVLMVAPTNLLLNAAVAWQAPALLHFIAVYLFTSMLYRLLIGPGWLRQKAQLPDALRQRIQHHLWITGASIVLSFIVLRQSEALFLKLFASSEAIGYFNIAYTIGFALSALIPGAYASLLLPMMSRRSRDSDGGAGTFHAGARYLLILALPMAVGTWLLGESLILTLYGPAYQQAATVLMWVIGGVSFTAVCQVAISLLVTRDHQLEVLRINFLVALLVLLLDAVLIGYAGLAGAGPAFLLGNLLHGSMMVRAALRRTPDHWPWQSTLRAAVAAVVPVPLLMLWASYMTLAPLALLLSGAVIYSACYIALLLWLFDWRDDERQLLTTLLRYRR